MIDHDRCTHSVGMPEKYVHPVAGVILSNAAGEKVWSFDKRDYTAAKVSIKVKPAVCPVLLELCLPYARLPLSTPPPPSPGGPPGGSSCKLSYA